MIINVKKKKPINPFYPLLVVAGIVFTVTACSYGVMMFQSLGPVSAGGHVSAGSLPSGRGLMFVMREHGISILIGEVIVLAVASLAAMATDGYWTRRSQENQDGNQLPATKTETNSEKSDTTSSERKD